MFEALSISKKFSLVRSIFLTGVALFAAASNLPVLTNAAEIKCPPKQFILAKRDGTELCVTYEEFALAIGNAPGALSEGENLNPGGRLISENGRFTLTVQHDGNLVLLQNNFGLLWSSGTSGKLGARLVLSNGKLSLQNLVNGKNETIWSSASENSQAETLLSRLVVQNDGNVVIYSRQGTPIWATQTRGIVPVPMTFVLIKPGTFTMGSPDSEADRISSELEHEVKLTKSFEIQTTEVTQEQWYSVMGKNPSRDNLSGSCPSDFVVINGVTLCPKNPVTKVSWNDTQEFIQHLNQKKDGYTYRLPTEAEWEYAARAGSQAAHYGSATNPLHDYAWCDRYSLRQSQAVATKKPNAWGLYDMLGNVWEWVQDYLGDYPSNHTGGPVYDPTGPGWGMDRVFRGSSWADYSRFCRFAARVGRGPKEVIDAVGFRLVRTR